MFHDDGKALQGISVDDPEAVDTSAAELWSEPLEVSSDPFRNVPGLKRSWERYLQRQQDEEQIEWVPNRNYTQGHNIQYVVHFSFLLIIHYDWRRGVDRVVQAVRRWRLFSKCLGERCRVDRSDMYDDPTNVLSF